MTSATADQAIAACTALLGSGTLAAQTTAIAYNNRGFAYVAKRQWNLAIADYTAALRIDPTFADAYNGRGFAYDAKSQWNLAISDFIAGLRIDPNDAVAYNNRGFAYHAKGQDDLAIPDYTAALRIDPNFANAYYNRGNADHAKSQWNLAVADFTAALRIDPNFALLAHRGRGVTFFAMGRFRESAADFKRSIELQPSDVKWTLWLHMARLRSGDNDGDLAARSNALDTIKWPAPILGLYLGRQTPGQALAAARDVNQRCEASFYVAEWRLWRRETAQARTGLARALEICPHSHIEYGVARAELTRLAK